MLKNIDKIMDKIARLKEQRNAIILAHNYVGSEVKTIADVVCGSLGMINAGRNTNADVIVVCGVDFMVENVAILNPDKIVLNPVEKAICPLAQRITVKEIQAAKMSYPDAHTLLYMNSSADAKAKADCVCTADNAVKMVTELNGGLPILFGPDYCLSYFIRKRTAHTIINVPINSYCPIHHKLSYEDILKAKMKYPNAEIVGHPECRPEVQDCVDFLGSSTETIEYCKHSDSIEFLVADEVGSLEVLRERIPNKTFNPTSTPMVCHGMKKAKLTDVLNVLETNDNQVIIPKETAINAKNAIDKMFTLS